jgi:hypothetical protein
MSLVIDLPPAQETRLQEEAHRAGVTINDLVYQAIAEKFPVEMDENAQALRLIEQWIAEAPTDPDQVKEAQEDLRSFQRSLNQTRTEAGARLVYPGVE